MATPLIPTLSKYMRRLPSYQRFTYSIPSVLAASTSPRYELLINSDEGTIEQLRINYPIATDIKAFIFTSDLGARGTLEHLIETPVIADGCFSQGKLGILFENTDPEVPSTLDCDLDPKGVYKLYVEIDNTGVAATGIIELELFIQVNAAG